MARILFSWELGGALGHLATIRSLAEELHARGHEIHLAARDAVMVPWTLQGIPVAFHPIPEWRPGRSGSLRDVRTYAHILYNIGYGHPPSLTAQLRAWRSVLREVKPHVLVCETSPTALLAARGTGVPTVFVASGFGVPPRSYPLPDITFWDPTSADSRRADEDALTALINATVVAAGGKPLARLHELFDATRTAIRSVPELDPYGNRPMDSYMGCVARLPGRQTPWPNASARRVFAYLKPFPELPQLLEQLRRRDLAVLIYGPDLPPDLTSRYGSDGLQFVEQPVDVADMSRTASLIINNATHGLVLQALRAGVPGLCFPLTLDQHAVARRIDTLGAGKYCSPWGSNRIASSLDAVLDDPAFSQRAREFASRYAHLDARAQAGQLAAGIDALAS